MTKIEFHTWNATHDAGRVFDEGEADLLERFPDDGEAIRAYRTHFARTLTGQVPGTGAVIAELQRAGVGLVGPHELVCGDVSARPGAFRHPAPLLRRGRLRHRRGGEARSGHLRAGLRTFRARSRTDGVRRRLAAERGGRGDGRADGDPVPGRRVLAGRVGRARSAGCRPSRDGAGVPPGRGRRLVGRRPVPLVDQRNHLRRRGLRALLVREAARRDPYGLLRRSVGRGASGPRARPRPRSRAWSSSRISVRGSRSRISTHP